ncbi:MAG: hypothetical protein QW788_03315 [Candidatus Hadarchaeales archaeon]
MMREIPVHPAPTLCGKCGLFYLYPKWLDYEHNPCPRCDHPNNEHRKGGEK